MFFSKLLSLEQRPFSWQYVCVWESCWWVEHALIDTTDNMLIEYRDARSGTLRHYNPVTVFLTLLTFYFCLAYFSSAEALLW